MNVIISALNSFYSYIASHYRVPVFFIYVVLMAVGISRHEPWMDEAQAWLLAKDLSLKELFVTYLRYEGSPGLWHLILLLPAKLGLPYYSMHILSAIFSAAGVWLFIRYAPVSVYIKILYPFTFFVFFQYGVVARSYCLIAPVLFLLAIHYSRAKERPYIFTGLLCALANISFHTFLIAGSLAFLHFLQIGSQWKSLHRTVKIRQLISLFIFTAVACLVIFIVKTPPDQTFAGYTNSDAEKFFEINKNMIGGSFVMNEFDTLPWLSATVSFAVLLVTLYWLFRNKTLAVYLLPLLLLSALFGIKYHSPWHEGILFLLWLFVLWISFDKNRNAPLSSISRVMHAALGMVMAVQVFWCAKALHYDFFHNYSGSKSLAGYIKEKHLENEKIFASGWRTIAVLPYFSRNIFYNHNNGSKHRFWNWSTTNVTAVGAGRGILDTIAREQPGLVIFASDHIASQQVISLPGYSAVAFFEGYLCWKTGLIEPECYLVFRRKR